MCSSLVSKGSVNSRAMGSLPVPRNFLGLQWSLRRVLLSVVPGPGPHWLTVTPDLTCILNADSRDSVYFRSKSADRLWVWFSSPGCPEEVAGDEAAVYSSARPETGPGRGPLQRLSPHLVLSATSEDFFMMSFLSTVKCFFKIVWFGGWRDS